MSPFSHNKGRHAAQRGDVFAKDGHASGSPGAGPGNGDGPAEPQAGVPQAAEPQAGEPRVQADAPADGSRPYAETGPDDAGRLPGDPDGLLPAATLTAYTRTRGGAVVPARVLLAGEPVIAGAKLDGGQKIVGIYLGADADGDVLLESSVAEYFDALSVGARAAAELLRGPAFSPPSFTPAGTVSVPGLAEAAGLTRPAQAEGDR